MQRVAVSEIVMIGCPNFFSLLQFYMLTQTFSKVVNSQSYPESDFLLALQKKKKNNECQNKIFTVNRKEVDN